MSTFHSRLSVHALLILLCAVLLWRWILSPAKHRHHRREEKRMRQHGGGVIINVSSGAGRLRVPGLSAYGASKAALDLISNTVRKELVTENIRVVTIYPPNTATDAAKHMLGDPRLLISIASNALESTSMVPKTAESVAEKIVEAARNEPADLFLDEGAYKEAAF